MQFLAHVGIALATTLRRLAQRADLAGAVGPARAFPARPRGPRATCRGSPRGARHGGGPGGAAHRRGAGRLPGRRWCGSAALAGLVGAGLAAFAAAGAGVSGSPTGAICIGAAAPATGLTGGRGGGDNRRHEPHLLRHPADRQSASRQLSRRDPQLGRAAARLRLHLLHRRSARADPAAGPGRAARQHARGDGRLYRRRHRSRALHHLQPEHGVRPMPSLPGCSAA